MYLMVIVELSSVFEKCHDIFKHHLHFPLITSLSEKNENFLLYFSFKFIFGKVPSEKGNVKNAIFLLNTDEYFFGEIL
jgi:hypothetical protein